ncbi:MAG: 16S rRNA (uracil(1498)-N(3))-methyltransferase [Patescibacteria group bacterium]
MLFYLNDPKSRFQTGHIYEHLKSHRLEVGKFFRATDLKGGIFECRLIEMDKRKQQAEIEVLKQAKLEPDQNMVLIQAIPDKLYLEKLVEISVMAGFKSIWMFNSQFSPKYNLNIDRLNKIALQATLLTEQTYPCELKYVDLSDLLKQNEVIQQSLILERETEQSLNVNNLTNLVQYAWVGPEGGWSDTEISQFIQLKIPFQSLSDSKTYPAWLAGSAWKFSL